MHVWSGESEYMRITLLDYKLMTFLIIYAVNVYALFYTCFEWYNNIIMYLTAKVSHVFIIIIIIYY